MVEFIGAHSVVARGQVWSGKATSIEGAIAPSPVGLFRSQLRLRTLWFRYLVSRNVLCQPFDWALEVLAQLVEDVSARDIPADIRHARQGHPVKPGFARNLFHGDDPPLAKGAVGDQFFQAVTDQRNTTVDG